LEQMTKRSNFRYSRMYYQNADAEILLLGNSRGLMFYQPEVEKLTNKKSFNFSYNGLIQEVNPTAAGGAKLTHLFRYNSEIWQRAMRYIKGSDETWLNDREINQFMMDQATIENPLDFTFSSEKDLNPEDLMLEIKSLVEYAEAKNIKVQLVVNPYYPPFFNRSNGFENWKSQVSKITGKKVHDYSTALSEPKFFTDYQHCNKLGSVEYLRLLKRDGLLE